MTVRGLHSTVGVWEEGRGRKGDEEEQEDKDEAVAFVLSRDGTTEVVNISADGSVSVEETGNKHAAGEADPVVDDDEAEVDSIVEDRVKKEPQRAGKTQAGPESDDGSKARVFGTELRPSQVVAELDQHIVGQGDAKRAVAVALRNRYRRSKLSQELQEDVVPRNILMIGPTGVGKTEVARRLAKMTDSPFIKVEATKFTEVGFHGRDVDSIIRDLADSAVQQVRARMRKDMIEETREMVEDKVLDLLCGANARASTRESFRAMLREGALDDRVIEVDVPEPPRQAGGHGMMDMGQGTPMLNIQELMKNMDKAFGGGGRGSGSRQKMTIGEYVPLLEESEADKKIVEAVVNKEAVAAVEQAGIVFIDEIDKICSSSSHHGVDASSEGVQRDLLPLLEGTTINTKYGNIKTDYILFCCSGAFHACKPSDLLAELQGRLPIRVELQGLGEEELYRILTEPKHNVIHQQVELLATEDVHLQFTEDAVREIARVAAEVNRTVENIGARRLHTIMERIVEEISFDAPDYEPGTSVEIDAAQVRARVGDMLEKGNLQRFVL